MKHCQFWGRGFMTLTHAWKLFLLSQYHFMVESKYSYGYLCKHVSALFVFYINVFLDHQCIVSHEDLQYKT